MKAKQLAILLVLGVALGYAWLVLSKRNQASWSDSGAAGAKIVDFPINDVAHVVIKTSDSELNLVKKADQWTVKERADYPASFEQVSGLLRKLWELKTVQEVKVGPSQMPRLELVEPGKGDKAGTLVQFLGADDKPLSALLVGKKHLRKGEGGEMDLGGGGGEGAAAGRYVKPASGEKVSLVSETLEEVDPKPERWLSKDFIKIEGPKSIAVAGPQTWTLTRESATAEWKLADAKPEAKLDTSKVSPLGSIFSSASFNDILAPDAKLEDPTTTATIETFDGFRYELKIGKPNGDNYPVLVKVSAEFAKERTPGKDEKPEDKTRLDGEFVVKQKQLEEKLTKEKKMEGRPYLVAKFSVDPLLKERSGLFPDKPAEPAPPGAAPSPISVTTPPISVTTPPMTARPRIEAVTPPVQAPPFPPKAPTTPPPAPKVEAVTPPVSAPPIPKPEEAKPPVPATPAPKPEPAPPAPPAAPEPPKPSTPDATPAHPTPPAPAAAPSTPPPPKSEPAPQP